MKRPRSFWDTVLVQSPMSVSTHADACALPPTSGRECPRDIAAMRCSGTPTSALVPISALDGGLDLRQTGNESQISSRSPSPSTKEVPREFCKLDTPLSTTPLPEFATQSSPPLAQFPHPSSSLSPAPPSSSSPPPAPNTKACDRSPLGLPGTHVCISCGVSFLRSSHLRLHVRTLHHKLKPFRCSACPASFSHVSSKYRHFRTVHLKRRDFSCARCGQAFAERSAVQKHCRTVHEGSRPYPCPICGFRFHFKLHLAQHVATVHDKLRPHGCPLCDARFGQRSSLNRHIRQIHGIPAATAVAAVQAASKAVSTQIPAASGKSQPQLQQPQPKLQSMLYC